MSSPDANKTTKATPNRPFLFIIRRDFCFMAIQRDFKVVSVSEPDDRYQIRVVYPFLRSDAHDDAVFLSSNIEIRLYADGSSLIYPQMNMTGEWSIDQLSRLQGAIEYAKEIAADWKFEVVASQIAEAQDKGANATKSELGNAVEKMDELLTDHIYRWGLWSVTVDDGDVMCVDIAFKDGTDMQVNAVSHDEPVAALLLRAFDEVLNHIADGGKMVGGDDE